MKQIKKCIDKSLDFIDFVFPDGKIYAGLSILCFLIGLGGQIHSSIQSKNKCEQTPIYRDVNKDGVKDKIRYKTIPNHGLFGTEYLTSKKEVLYGANINGKTIYLSKKQLDE